MRPHWGKGGTESFEWAVGLVHLSGPSNATIFPILVRIGSVKICGD